MELFPTYSIKSTEGSRLMRISIVRISLLRLIQTITKICLMRFYVLFILLLHSIAKNLANVIILYRRAILKMETVLYERRLMS